MARRCSTSTPTYLWHSLQLVIVTVLVCTTVAIVLANAQRFGRPRLTRLASRATAVGYAVPGPVVGIGVLLTVVAVDAGLEWIGLDLPGVVATGSLLVLVYAYAVRFLAPGLGAVESGVGQVPEEMTASARTLGAAPDGDRCAGPLAALRRRRWSTAAVLVGVDALKELPIVLLLRPFGFDTLPVWVYNLASESRFQQAALPALSIVAVAFVPVYLLSAAARSTMTDRAAIVADVRSDSVRSTRSTTCRSTSARHELFALVGPSGCGKSTLLRMIAGLHPDRVGDDRARWRRRSTTVGVAYRRSGDTSDSSSRSTPCSRTCHGRQNIGFGVRRASAEGTDTRVHEVLDVVGLDGYGDRYPHELSGGERQRVALARALAPRPALVLLDEPFASLDPNLRARVRDDVVEILRSTGTPAVFVTHDQTRRWRSAIGSRSCATERSLNSVRPSTCSIAGEPVRRRVHG